MDLGVTRGACGSNLHQLRNPKSLLQSWVRVSGLGFGVRVSGFRVLGFGFRVLRFRGLGFWGLEFCVLGFGGLGFRGLGLTKHCLPRPYVHCSGAYLSQNYNEQRNNEHAEVKLVGS